MFLCVDFWNKSSQFKCIKMMHLCFVDPHFAIAGYVFTKVEAVRVQGSCRMNSLTGACLIACVECIETKIQNPTARSNEMNELILASVEASKKAAYRYKTGICSCLASSIPPPPVANIVATYQEECYTSFWLLEELLILAKGLGNDAVFTRISYMQENCSALHRILKQAKRYTMDDTYMFFITNGNTCNRWTCYFSRTGRCRCSRPLTHRFIQQRLVERLYATIGK